MLNNIKFILILIVAKSLPLIKANVYTFVKQPSIIFIKISFILFIYIIVLHFNSIYIQSIGSCIGRYSGLLQQILKSLYDYPHYKYINEKI